MAISFVDRHPEHAQGIALVRMKTGASGRISYLATSDPGRTRRLLALGILPGVRVRLIQRIPAYVLEVGFTRVALDNQIASAIFVEPDS